MSTAQHEHPPAAPSPSCDRRYKLGKLAISAVNMQEVLARLDAQVQRRQSGYICVANVRVAVLCQWDREFCRVQNQSMITLPDGMPLAWAAWAAGVKGVDRTTGPDLITEVLRESPSKGYCHYLYGEEPAVLERLIETVRRDYPAVEIRGWRSPPFRQPTQEDLDQAVEEINRLKPTFVWVALGAPKQERWMANIVDRVDSAILVGVGAAFRFVIGEYRHPPRIVQRLGLEGFYWRFSKNPFREMLWYAKHVPIYTLLLLGVLVRRLFKRR